MKTALALLFLLGAALVPGRADDDATPGAGFEAARYENLWKTSPFAVATPESGATSPDYSLVGVAEFDNVSYASLVDKHNQEHFVVSTGSPARGVTLISIIRDNTPARNSAVLEVKGERLVLALENNPPPTVAPVVAAVPNAEPPLSNTTSTLAQRLLMRRAPHAYIHRPIVHIPPPPNDSNTSTP